MPRGCEPALNHQFHKPPMSIHPESSLYWWYQRHGTCQCSLFEAITTEMNILCAHYDVCSTPSLFETTLAGPCECSYLGADALQSDVRTILRTLFKWTLGGRLVSGPSSLPGLDIATRILLPSASRGMCCSKIALLISICKRLWQYSSSILWQLQFITNSIRAGCTSILQQLHSAFNLRCWSSGWPSPRKGQVGPQ